MSLGDSKDLVGAAKPTAIENSVYDKNLQAYRISEIPSGLKMRLDFTGGPSGQPVYQGFAPSGLAENAEGWLIYKFTYDGDNMTERNVFGAVAADSATWAGRAGYTYD